MYPQGHGAMAVSSVNCSNAKQKVRAESDNHSDSQRKQLADLLIQSAGKTYLIIQHDRLLHEVV
jgi:hypothetical protein